MVMMGKGMKMARFAGVAALAMLVGASACTTAGSGNIGPQGWSSADQTAWYAATQGSRLIPWAWAKALERSDTRAGTQGAFFDATYLARYRLLPRGTGELPVGLAIDQQDDSALTVTKLRWFAAQKPDEQWLGLNCAACHTGEINWQGKPMRIDGGPGLTDFQGFIEGLDAALAATRADPAKWDRFAAAVLKGNDTPANRAMLMAAFDAFTTWQGKIAAANTAPLRYGYARVDAFGHIYNKVALLAGPDPQPFNPADAPVSYPFLWNTHQADRVQWNGIAQNMQLKSPFGSGRFDYGAMGRNGGEVIGVYGDVAVRENPGLKGFKSSLQVRNLERLEQLLARLQPPAWPAAFPVPDTALVKEGDALFAQRCTRCHTELPRNDLKTPYKVNISLFNGPEPPGTDPWMACNAYSYEAQTQKMAGLKPGFVGGNDPPLGETAPVANMLRTIVVGSLVGNAGGVVLATVPTFLGVTPLPRVIPPGAIPPTPEQARAIRLKRCMTESNAFLGYRARPLTGVWATAPYLHNGSVPTLYDLLLPPAQRPASFAVGARDYDPVKVGYVTTPSPQNSFIFVARKPDGTMIAGNGNEGHDYGNAGLSERQRLALVEYMKTL